MRLVIIATFLSIFSLGNTEKPEYLKPCSKSSPDFIKCANDHGNEALPFLLQGDKRLKIPNMLPLRFPQVDVNAGPNLKIKLTNVDFNGLDSMKLNDIGVDFDQKTIYLDLHANLISLNGQYEIDGKIMILPVKGNGPINLTVSDSQFKYSFTYKLENKGGAEYAVIQDNDKLDYKIGKGYFTLDNLFNGNKQMGDNVNKFLNDNQQDVIKELDGAITGTIINICRIIGRGVLGSIPFNDLFLN